MQDFLIVIEPSRTGYAAFSPDVPGCAATGASVEETLTEMRSALIFHFEDLLATGEKLPIAKGLEHHLHNGQFVFESGDLLTTFAASGLRDETAVVAAA